MSKSVKEFAIRLLSLFIHVFLEVVSYGMFILLLSNSIRTTWQIYQPIERSKLFYQVVWWFPAAAILYEHINLLGWNDHELLYTSLQTSLWWLYTPACVGLNQWWMIDKSVRPFLGFVKTGKYEVPVTKKDQSGGVPIKRWLNFTTQGTTAIYPTITGHWKPLAALCHLVTASLLGSIWCSVVVNLVSPAYYVLAIEQLFLDYFFTFKSI